MPDDVPTWEEVLCPPYGWPADDVMGVAEYRDSFHVQPPYGPYDND